MSRKKTVKTENNLFIKNINMLVDGFGGKYEFAEAIGASYDAVRQWCIGQNLPSGDVLLTLREKLRLSIDWLLAGEENYPVGVGLEPPPAIGGPGWSAEDIRLGKQLKTILDSKHPVIVPAIVSNLAAFELSVEKEKKQDGEIKRLKKRVGDLEESMRQGPHTGCGEAASSRTGKRAM